MATDMKAVVLTGQLQEVTQRFQRELNKVSATIPTNAIENISLDGTTQAVSNKTVVLDLSAYAKKTDIGAGISFKGTVANFAALPNDATAGDMYNITAAGGTDENGVAIKAGDNVIKTATGWDNFGGTVDLSGKVDKVEGKQLSTEDFSPALKTKLEDIATGAQVNVIETIKVDNVALTPTNKAVNIDLSGKTDKVASATAGHLAALDANGNLTDSGHGIATDNDITTMLTDIFGAEETGGSE